MKVIVVSSPGGPEVLQVQEVEDPKNKRRRVSSQSRGHVTEPGRQLTAGQRLGFYPRYPPPLGSSELLGLECSGTIEAVGEHVSRWKAGDQQCIYIGFTTA